MRKVQIPFHEKHGAVIFPRPIVGNHVEDALTFGPGVGHNVVACDLPTCVHSLQARTLNGIHVLGSCQWRHTGYCM